MSKTPNRYRKVSVRVWGDDKFCKLSRPKPNGQTLWFYLITGPQTTALPCAFSAGEASLAEALDWPLPAFRKVFTEVFDKGMVQADWKSRLVFVPNALKHNPPESPNVVIGWRSAFNELPDCPLKKIVFVAVKVFLDEWAKTKEKGEVFIKAFGEDYAKDFSESEHNRADTEQSRADTQQNALARKLQDGFESLWQRYPVKDGRKDAERHFSASVQTEQDLTDIDAALTNYLEHIRTNDWKRHKNGSTWFNQWRDWLDWKEPEQRQLGAGNGTHQGDRKPSAFSGAPGYQPKQ